MPRSEDCGPPPASLAQVDFLIADAKMGLTFAQLARDAARGSQTRVRNLANAEAALAAVRHHAAAVTFAAADAGALHSLLDELAMRVKALRD